MEWIEISITAKRVAIEEIATLFEDISSSGYIEEDVPERDDLSCITLYDDTSKTEQEWLAYIEKAIQEANYMVETIQTRIVTDEDWYTSWQQYIQVTEILPHIIIKPAWQDYEGKAGETVLEIDSDLSFGTGAHETTQCCAELIATYGRNKKTCLDIGTGTGILLLVAHTLGISRLIGIDIEASAAEQAKRNCQTNKVEAEIICGDLAVDFNGQADLILANLTVDPLKILLPIINQKLAKDGILIISGIIDERYDEIMPYITKHWQIIEEKVKGPWHTFALKAAKV